MKKFLTLALAAIFAIGLLSGCTIQKNTLNQGANSNTNSDGKLKIAIVPKLVGIPYFNASEKGAKQAAEKLGVDLIYTGPTEPDAAQQVQVIEDLISKKVDVIAVAPNDPAALTPV